MIATAEDAILVDLLAYLDGRDYRFVTTTPETHRRVLGRKIGSAPADLRGAFGWSLPFAPDLLPARLFEGLAGARLLVERDGEWRSRVRVSSIGDRLFLHSGFPTAEQNAVFFGPDTYRFVRFLDAELGDRPPVRRLVDIGTGTGAGAIAAARLLPDAQLILTDLNPLALRYARVNVRHAGLKADFVLGKGLDEVAGPFDLAIANPPFMHDAGGRTYRHGGGELGSAATVDWAVAAMAKLAPGGRILFYTGSAIVDGVDQLEQALRAKVREQGCTLRYAEIDPDIFGEQLEEPDYDSVERIAAVGAVIDRA